MEVVMYSVKKITLFFVAFLSGLAFDCNAEYKIADFKARMPIYYKWVCGKSSRKERRVIAESGLKDAFLVVGGVMVPASLLVILLKRTLSKQNNNKIGSFSSNQPKNSFFDSSSNPNFLYSREVELGEKKTGNIERAEIISPGKLVIILTGNADISNLGTEVDLARSHLNKTIDKEKITSVQICYNNGTTYWEK